MKAKLGIIGGTGFYELQGLEIKRQVSLETPFGRPSDKLIIGEKDGQEVMFLSRHSRGHVLIPSNINYRANIYAMKKFGVTHLVSVSTVGSFKEEIKPGSVVFVDQFFDRTKIHIQDTFFDDNIAVHVAFGDPVCPVLHSALVDIATSAGVDFTPQGIYLNIDGPAFSTRAESIIYRSWGVSVIGMTNIYEAKLSREAEIHFGTIAQVTDFDSWYGESVDVTEVFSNLGKALESTTKVLQGLIEKFPLSDGDCNCDCALENAIVTDRSIISDDVRNKYNLFLKKYF